MDEFEKALTESAWRKAYRDTKEWSGTMIFLILDAAVSALIGLWADNALIGFAVFVAGLILAFVVFWELAPVKQRNILREGHKIRLLESEELIQSLKAKLNNNKPMFDSGQAQFGSAEYGKNRVVFHVEATLVNIGGSPSILQDISGEVAIDNQTYSLSLVDGMQFKTFTFEGADLRFKREDLLAEKAIANPIAQGAAVVGLLLFVPTNEDEEAIIFNSRTSYDYLIVHAHDVNFERHSFVVKNTGVNSMKPIRIHGSLGTSVLEEP